MRIVFATDLHMHNFTEFAKPTDNISDRFEAQLATLQKTFDIAREKKANLFIGGDLFHNRGAVGTKVFNKTFEVFANNPDVPVYILRGNHDSVTNSIRTVASIEPLRALKNVFVITHPTEILFEEEETDEENGKGVNVLFMPYGDETEEMKQYIQEYEPEGEKNIFVGHLGLEGSLQGKGTHRLAGAFGLQDLRPDVFDYILLGHYHKRQTLGDNPNFIYGGNFMQVNFGDEGQEKGVHFIDTEKEHGIEFIPIKNKMFVTIDGNNLPDNLDDIIENNYVRFIGTKEQVQAIKNIDTQEQLDFSNVRVEVERDYSKETRMGLDSTMTEVEIVERFAKEKYPNAVEASLECLREVM